MGPVMMHQLQLQEKGQNINNKLQIQAISVDETRKFHQIGKKKTYKVATDT